MRTKESYCLCLYIICRGFKDIHLQFNMLRNHENITLDVCNIDDKIWTNNKGYLKVLKFQYVQAMQICLNKLQKIFCSEKSPGRKQMYTEPYYSTTTWEKQPSIWFIKMFFQSLLTFLFMINFYYSNTL